MNKWKQGYRNRCHYELDDTRRLIQKNCDSPKYCITTVECYSFLNQTLHVSIAYDCIKKKEIQQKNILCYMSLLPTTLSQGEFIMIPQGNSLFIHSNINWVVQSKISVIKMNISMG